MLDFILSNIYVIAIIGFALISFLGKGKSGAGQRPKQGMPTFGGSGEENGSRTYEEPSSSREEQSYDPSPVYQSTSMYTEHERDRERWELEREKEHAMDLLRRSEGYERTSLAEDQDSPEYDVATVTSSPKPISPLAEEAAKGIIWSEILGPPRAKRGFHKRNS